VEHELLIEAGHTEHNYWRDLFQYRELFNFLAWRDVLVPGNFWTARS
jgi:lipopolysaccharide transport system permease protein